MDEEKEMLFRKLQDEINQSIADMEQGIFYTSEDLVRRYGLEKKTSCKLVFLSFFPVIDDSTLFSVFLPLSALLRLMVEVTFIRSLYTSECFVMSFLRFLYPVSDLLFLTER